MTRPSCLRHVASGRKCAGRGGQRLMNVMRRTSAEQTIGESRSGGGDEGREAPGRGSPPIVRDRSLTSAMAPDPEVTARLTRRRFTTPDTLERLRKAEACPRPDDLGSLLRTEGLSASLSRRAPRVGRRRARTTDDRPRRLRGAFRTRRQGDASTDTMASSGLDQPDREEKNGSGCPRNDDRRPGQPAGSPRFPTPTIGRNRSSRLARL